MNTEHTNTETSQTPDDLDRALSAYFKHQMPSPWPAFQHHRVTEPARHPAGGASYTRSRVTLAASIAALLGFGLYLSSGPKPEITHTSVRSTDPSLLQNATADGDHLLKHNKTNGTSKK